MTKISGGVNNLVSAFSYTNPIPNAIGDYVFECAHPLNSDNNNHHFNLSLGNNVGLLFYFIDYYTGGDYASHAWGPTYPAPYDNPPIGAGANVVIASSPSPTQDTDNDSLYDMWEVNGIDTNGDGIIDLNLPALGADPFHKDVFVEIDWMEDGINSNRPRLISINEIISVFSNAPVSNPDGVDGIKLHVELSISLPHTQFIIFNRLPWDPSNVVDFDDIKASNFDSSREQIFHYCIFAHQLKEAPLSSGMSEIFGNIFIVSLGAFSGNCEKGVFLLNCNIIVLHGCCNLLHFDLWYKKSVFSPLFPICSTKF